MIGLIGSCALNMWLKPEQQRTPQDFDIVATYDDIQRFVANIKLNGEKVLAQYPTSSGKKVFIKTDKRIIEAEVAWPGSSGEALLALMAAEANLGVQGVDDYDRTLLNVPSLHLLYMLKMSHRYLKNSPHFLKTLRDIQMMREMGATILPEHEQFYKDRMAWTYDYKHPKLNQSKGDFFTDDVPYVYDHDSIHEAMRHLDKPAYAYFKPDDSEVAVSRGMFEKLDPEVQLFSVLEEVYVLALERSQIPYPETDRKKSFDMAHMKVCTSITSGWWREFAWENYDAVQQMYYEGYVDRFWTAEALGQVKPHNKEQ